MNVWTFLKYSLLLSLLCRIVPSYAFNPGEKQITQSFYSELPTVVQQPVSEQIHFLFSYISEFPRFEPAYSKLLERFVIHDSLDAAIHSFQNLTENPQTRQHALWMLAKIYELKERPDSANVYYKQALKSQPTPSLLLKDYVEFDVKHEQRFAALDAIQQNTPEDYARARAFFLYASSYFDEARPLLLDALQRHPSPDLCYAYCCALIQQFNTETSQQGLNEGLELVKSWGDLYYQSLILSYLALVSTDARKPNEALNYAQAALELAQSIDNYYAIAIANYYKGKGLQIKQDHKSAINALKKSYHLFSRLKNKEKQADSAYWIAKSSYNVSSFSHALTYTDICAELYTKINNPFNLAYTYRLKGQIYNVISLPDMAVRNFRKAIEIAKANSYEGMLKTFQNELLELDLGQYAPGKAADITLQCVKNARERNLGDAELHYWHELAKYYNSRGMIKQALHQYKAGYLRALELNNPTFLRWFLVPLGSLYGQTGDTTKAIEALNNAIDYAGQNDLPRIKAWALLEFGKLYEQQQDVDRAIDYYQNAIHTYEAFRDNLGADDIKIGGLSNRQECYLRLAECYFQQYQQHAHPELLDSIFQAEELMHARMLKDILANRPLYTSLQDSLLHDADYMEARNELVQRQKQLRQERNHSSEEWDKLLADVEAAKYEFILKRIQAILEHMQQDSLNRSTRQLSDVKNQLAHQEQTVLLYHLSERTAFALAINADSVAVIGLPTNLDSAQAAIKQLTNPLHHVDELGIEKTPFYSQIAFKLYQTLFQPIEQNFPLHHTILVLTNPAIANLPFDLLLTEPPQKPFYMPVEPAEYAENLLVHDYAFFYSPTTFTMDAGHGRRRQPRMLVLADPFRAKDYTENPELQFRTRTGWSFKPLLFSNLEAQRIQHYFKQCRILTDTLATEEQLQQPGNYNMLHIASHAFVDTLSEAFSGLVLYMQDHSPQDGILMGYEIAEHNAPYDLVTLSACETGRGKLAKGEGVLGLPRQFLIAGAKSVLMSHWKVDDRFTSEFMPKFYAHYINNGLSKAEALSHAKLDILTEGKVVDGLSYQHPFFWASFSLYGDPGSPRQERWPIWVFGVLGVVGLFFGMYLGFRSRRKKH